MRPALWDDGLIGLLHLRASFAFWGNLAPANDRNGSKADIMQAVNFAVLQPSKCATEVVIGGWGGLLFLVVSTEACHPRCDLGKRAVVTFLDLRRFAKIGMRGDEVDEVDSPHFHDFRVTAFVRSSKEI